MLAKRSSALLASLLEQGGDIGLTIDAQHAITGVNIWSRELPPCLEDEWVGKTLAETLFAHDDAAVASALSAARSGKPQRLDLVHSLGETGDTLPVQYQLLGEAGSDQVLAIGIDLRSLASLRQQLVNAQQALEQDYWRLRQVETRYRRIFDMVGDAVLVVDAQSRRVLEANPRANDLFADHDKGIVGKLFPYGIEADSARAVEDLFTEMRSLGRGQLHSVVLADGETRAELSASFLRQAGDERFLLRFAARDAKASAAGDPQGVYLQEVLRAAPDAVMLTDSEGRVLAVNQSFLELAQLVSEEQVLGHSADRWLGRSSVDMNVLLTNLREKSVVKLFSSTLVPHAGSPAQVEISACRLEDPDGPEFALFIRDVERRVARDHPVAAQLPRSIEQVTQRVGRVPLKELVRESTDLIEALCIETALKVTRDNRASAAELLGLSRQSLYAKLRRFDIGHPTESDT